MNQNLEDLSFEEALNLLEEAVGQLEKGDLKLEDALRIFEQGQTFAKFCSQKLEAASLRVEQLTADGEIIDMTG